MKDTCISNHRSGTPKPFQPNRRLLLDRWTPLALVVLFLFSNLPTQARAWSSGVDSGGTYVRDGREKKVYICTGECPDAADKTADELNKAEKGGEKRGKKGGDKSSSR
jgi:hypothetical protein